MRHFCSQVNLSFLSVLNVGSPFQTNGHLERARSRNFGSSLLSIYTSCHMFSAAAAVPKDIDLAKPDLLS
jgi:hypothetical protein